MLISTPTMLGVENTVYPSYISHIDIERNTTFERHCIYTHVGANFFYLNLKIHLRVIKLEDDPGIIFVTVPVTI